ncbi:hypothetical protein T492DRAFT_1141502 [Pavlovales sp. CCMP2436]|nr:hypothetical protein T492DRAFT_1141502 [Pavlovales sp. CCMP2436]
MPWWMRANLVCGAALQIGSCYAALLLSKLCFVRFEMTDTVERELGGKWTNFFRPLGVAVMAAWLIACVQLALFCVWAQARVRAHGPPKKPISAGAETEVDEARGPASAREGSEESAEPRTTGPAPERPQ